MSADRNAPLSALARQSGCEPHEIIDFRAYINPLGPPNWLRRVIAREIEHLPCPPDPTASRLVRAIRDRTGVPETGIVVGNGTGELLYALPHALDVSRAVLPVPSCAEYEAVCRLGGWPAQHIAGTEESHYALDLDRLGDALQPGALVLLGQPGNPTGQATDVQRLREWIGAHPDVTFVIDETYALFCEPNVSLLPESPANAIVLRSLGEFHAIPGLGAGFAVAREEVARNLRTAIPPASVNALAQAVGERAIMDSAYATRTRTAVAELRTRLVAGLCELPALDVLPGAANFLLLRITHDTPDGREIAEHLLRKHRIAVRVCDDLPGLGEKHLCLAVRTAEENQRLLDGLAELLAPARPPRCVKKPTPALMLQGTGSDVGKSVLAAALCRILLQDGVRVVPFKSQNMALNSFVTLDGGEMGRAQVVQAAACRLEPDVRMNPVLLKPSSEAGCQVIVMGHSIGQMKAQGYAQYREHVIQSVHQAYDELADEYDAVIIEGAGSPGEVNLKARDISNMHMALYAKCPVLLVGDIDRGGVYASFIGTWEVLDDCERNILAGFLVNRFRGDASMLADAHAYVYERTGRPVVGVVHHQPNLGLPDEDSVSFKRALLGNTRPADDEALDVVLVDLPFISNFTDADAFAVEPDVRLRVVRDPDDLGTPDLIILPGSKNVLGDIAAINNNGLGAALRTCAASGRSTLVGLCAGMQIMGRRVIDPHGLESHAGSTDGLNLLPIETEYALDKTLARTVATHLPSGQVVQGYEIHHGRSQADGALPVAFEREDGSPVGYRSEDGRVWGTYLHGVFDNDAFRHHILDALRARKGWAPLGAARGIYEIDTALDRLAGVVRESVDLDRIYQWMGLA